MPAARQPIKMSWRPVGDKGGYFTNSTSHDQVPDSTFSVTGAYVKNNAWVPNLGGSVQQSGLPGYATTLDIFNRYTGNSQTLTSTIVSGITDDGAGRSRVVNTTTFAVIRSSGSPQPTTGTGRYVFAPVKNRLYMANGTDVPVISPDATANSCIPWGFSPQTQNLGYQINQPGTGANAAFVGGSIGTCNTTNAANSVVTWASGPTFQYFKQFGTIVINGVRWTINSITSNTQLVLSGNAGALGGVPFNYAYTGITGNGTYTGTVPGPALNTLTAWGGPAFVVGPPSFPSIGSPVYPISVKYTTAAVTGVAALTMGTTYAEAAGAGVVRATQINVSNMAFENGKTYQYAVSYYNPTSGHVTNTSPLLLVNNGAPNNSNVSVTISGIKATNDTAYTRIILWRSAAGGSNLFPLAILNNDTGNDTGNTITYTDFMGDDTQLGVMSTEVAGTTGNLNIGKFAAPVGQNAPPPADLNYPTYWQGRFWGASQTQIGLIFYSCRSAGNNEDTTIGVPEECWPTDFTLPIPESDGRVTGFRTVGDNLFVLTDNSIYAIVGSSKLDYRLSKVSSKGKGASHFATCVIPGEDVNSTDVLVHFGNDGRLYFLFGSGGDFPISYAIQGELDALGAKASTANVAVWHTSVSTYVVLVPVAGATRYLYDLERKVWLKSIFTQYGSGMVEGLYGGVLTQLYTDGPGSASKLVAKDNLATGAPQTFTITTNIVSPGGAENRKGDKQLESVTVYTNEAPQVGWSLTATIDGNAIPCALVPNSAQYAAYQESSDAYVFVPQVNATGRLFQFAFTDTAPTSFSTAVYEIVATWTDNTFQPETGGKL